MPAWFINLAIGILFSWISFLLSPTPKAPKAGTLEDVNLPIARQGQEIGKIYGTVWIKAPHVAWYGDFKARAIRSKQGKKG